jgi:uncharacterized protein
MGASPRVGERRGSPASIKTSDFLSVVPAGDQRTCPGRSGRRHRPSDVPDGDRVARHFVGEPGPGAAGGRRPRGRRVDPPHAGWLVKLVDANVLLDAVDTDAERHEPSRRWLDRALSGDATVAFAWIALLAFVRPMTKAGLFPQPLTVDQAMDRVHAWLAASPAVVVEPTADDPRRCDACCRMSGSAATSSTTRTSLHRPRAPVRRGVVGPRLLPLPRRALAVERPVHWSDPLPEP